MRPRDRLAAIVLLWLAAVAWTGLALVLTTVYPDPVEVRLFVAGSIGVAIGLTATPLAWLAAFGRRGGTTRPGDWVRATRRGTLAGALGALLAALQVTGTASVPIVAFAFVLVVFLELTLSYRR